MLNKKIRKQIIAWFCNNLDEDDLLDSAIKQFRSFIFDENKNFITGGKEIFEFIEDRAKTLSEFNESAKKEKKIKLGQFFTKQNIWLKEHIKEFILNSNCNIAVDPFAGAGDLLIQAQNIGIKQVIGFDIDRSLKWTINDSLHSIPHTDNAIIITNPPYLAKQSATRKKIDLSKYFDFTKYDNVYLIALEKMLQAQRYVVAIIPESFINSNFKQKNLLDSITVLEENPFEDTENPVCVACFDSVEKDYSKIKIYKNDKLVSNLAKLQQIRIKASKNIKITFNDSSGWLGLRAVDLANDEEFIHFDFKEKIDYDWEGGIKVSSRHYSLINIDIPNNLRDNFIDEANRILSKIRKDSADILLTPFMGNTKSGVRRRRLDFKLARAILEQAFLRINNDK